MKSFGLLCFMVTALAFKVTEQNHVFGNSPVPDKVEGRIKRKVDIRDFPFVAQIAGFIFDFERKDLQTECPGVIITDRHVITAASCVNDDEPEDNQLIIGQSVVDAGSDEPIADIIIHPEYELDFDNNLDIAFVKTLYHIQFGASVAPCILADEELPPRLDVTLWGGRENSPQTYITEYHLKRIELEVISIEECQDYYERFNQTINDDFICAKSVPNDEDEDEGGLCTTNWGDRGAPAVDGDYVYALGAFARGCGAGSGPSVFTNLQAERVREFLIDHTGVEYGL